MRRGCVAAHGSGVHMKIVAGRGPAAVSCEAVRQARTLLIRAWCGQAPRFEPVRPESSGWIVGRDTVDGDSRMSRRHCEVRIGGGRWIFTDLGSANGSYVDARAVGGTMHCEDWQVLQVGRSLFVPLLVDAGAPLRMRHEDDDIVGPGLHGAVAQARSIAEAGQVVVFTGSTGCGFVQVARELHRALGQVGEFAAVDMSEPAPARLPAHGTLLVVGRSSLDDLVKTNLVRAALRAPGLRLCIGMNDSEGVVPTPPEPLLGRAGVVGISPLERRAVEIPWWVRHAVRSAPAEQAALEIDVTLPEACLLRSWARGLEDLVPAVQAAAAAAKAAGRTKVMGRDLADTAGTSLKDRVIDKPEGAPRGRREPPGQLRDRNHVAAVLVTHDHDRAAAARTLGVTLEALEQWIRRHRLEQVRTTSDSRDIDIVEDVEDIEDADDVV